MLLLLLTVSSALSGTFEDRLQLLDSVRAQRQASSAPTIPAEAYQTAKGGKVETGLVDVPGHKARLAWGVGVVDQPIDRYWAAINDDRNKVEYTKLSHLELLGGDYCGADRKVFQYLSVSLLTDRWWVVNQRMNAGISSSTGGKVREMTWKSMSGQEHLTPTAKEWADKGLEVGFTEGAWLLVDLGDGSTLVEYYTWSDAGGNVPARMASSFAAGGIDETIQAMGKLAAKGPSCL